MRTDPGSGTNRSSIWFAKLLMQALLLSTLGLLIAVGAGASASDAALDLAWGALLSGTFFFIALVLVSLALVAIDKWRGIPPWLGGVDETASGRLRDYDLGWSWKNGVGFLAALTLIALIDARNGAFWAGLPVGLICVWLPLLGAFGWVVEQLRRA